MPGKDEYKYTDLKTLSERTKGDVHFYGTVVDASFPYQTDKRWVVTAKVVDASLAKNGAIPAKNWVRVVFYAKKFEDLPIIQRIGDIVRVHRAEFQNFNDRKQLNVNLYYNSSWCLFAGNEKDEPLEPKVVNENKEANFFTHTPYNFSGRSFTWADDDVNQLKNLRTWTKKWFSSQWVHDLKTTRSQEFDVHGKVVKIKNNDQWTNTVYINDNDGNTYTANLYKKKFPGLTAGTPIRVRSVNANGSELSLSSHSNVLQFISNTKFGNALKKIKDTINASAPSGSAVSTITNKKQAGQAVTALKQLFFNPKKTSGAFHAQFSVVKTDPAKAASWGKGKKLSVKFIVKDHSTTDDKLYMVQCEDQAFFGKHKLDAAKKTLTAKGSFVDAVLTREGKNYFITNTKMN